jgi:hypothetical protein
MSEERSEEMSEVFFACNKRVTMRSYKSHWPGYNILWGHRNNNSTCEGLLVAHKDYENYLFFANRNRESKTFSMSITLHKNCLDDYYTLSDFQICNVKYCF